MGVMLSLHIKLLSTYAKELRMQRSGRDFASVYIVHFGHLQYVKLFSLSIIVKK